MHSSLLMNSRSGGTWFRFYLFPPNIRPVWGGTPFPLRLLHARQRLLLSLGSISKASFYETVSVTFEKGKGAALQGWPMSP